jgi:predicted lipid-binding transport protein (Tim44 family)
MGTIILAMIAIAIFLRLYLTFGKDSEKIEKDSIFTEMFQQTYYSSKAKKAEKVLNASVSPIEQIQAYDSEFQLEQFKLKALKAFEIIINSYAQGKNIILTDLVAISAMSMFAYEISKREDEKNKLVVNFVSNKSAEITSVRVENKKATIDIEFSPEIIFYVEDQNGNLVRGHKNKISAKKYICSFEKFLVSSEPSWKLSSIDSLPA